MKIKNRIFIFIKQIIISFLIISLFLFRTKISKVYAQSPSCIVPPSGLVSWWPGDGNANDIHGTNNGILQKERLSLCVTE